MKLYNLKAGMNSRRVRIFLAGKGVQIPLVEVDMMAGDPPRGHAEARALLGRGFVAADRSSLIGA